MRAYKKIHEVDISGLEDLIEAAEKYWEDVKPNDYLSNLRSYRMQGYIIPKGRKAIVVLDKNLDNVLEDWEMERIESYEVMEFDGEKMKVGTWTTPLDGEVYFVGRMYNKKGYTKANKGRLRERVSKEDAPRQISRIQAIVRKRENGDIEIINIGLNPVAVYEVLDPIEIYK